MINRKIVMIPGPTPTVRSIQDQMGRDTCAFGDPEFVKDYKWVIENLKTLMDCSGQAFVIAGSGSLAMEMAIANNTKAGDNLLIVSHGYFGDRFIDVAKRKNLNVDVIQSQWGKIVPIDQIEKKLSEKHYAAMTVSHVDTATGVLAPIEEIGKMMHEKFPDTIYIVDGVAATAGARSYVDSMHIDVLLTASQKAFGVCPGLALVFAGEKSLARRKSLGETIPEYFVDYEKWIPIMDDPSKYFATPAVNLIWAMKESLQIIMDEGLENRFARHEKQGAAMRAALRSLGFEILAEAGHEAPTLSNVLYMDGVDDNKFRSMVQEEGIIVAGGLGAYAGKMFRIGHMGNADIHDLVCALAAIERTLYRLGVPVKLGSSVGIFMEEMME